METNLEYNDSFLLIALQEGQEKAFDYIFRKFYKALCAQANIYTGDLDISQSLVQDCFIKFWETRERATEIQNLSSYLSFMVRNKCIDYLRKVSREVSLEPGNDKRLNDIDSETALLSGEFEEKLVEALSRLPERCRQAFEYSRFEGLTYPEIASRMNISIKAVEALMTRSLKFLRVELKDYLPILVLLFQMRH